MGQQQILLIVLSVILVGVAVAIGISMFRDNALSSNRDAIYSDLSNFAVTAYKYRMTPTSMGGGGNSYVNLSTDYLGTMANENATYTLDSVAANSVQITAVGTQGTTPWNIVCTINAQGVASYVVTGGEY